MGLQRNPADHLIRSFMDRIADEATGNREKPYPLQTEFSWMDLWVLMGVYMGVRLNV
jgi:hypothetical protein